MQILKLLPLLSLAFLGFAKRDAVREVAGTTFDVVKVVGVKAELATIRTAVQAEITGGSLNEAAADFPAFVRRVAHSDVRDPARDLWGGYYALHVRTDRYVIASAGPDRRYSTDDDVFVTLPR